MTVEGLDRLDRKLTKTIPASVRKAVREALQKGADEIVATMKAFVPVDSGAAKASIGWTWGDAPKGTVTLGKVGPAREGSERITIYAGGGEAFYARYLEFGTRKMPPHPFFFPAYRLHKKRVRSRVQRSLAKAVKASGK